MFPVRNGLTQGDDLSPLRFNFALEYAIRRVQVNQDGLKLIGTQSLKIKIYRTIVLPLVVYGFETWSAYFT
jgi:hypothetical protein